MKKILISMLFLFSFCFSVSAQEFEITSDYSILYNLNEDIILYEENSDTKVSIASLTKMMTALVAIENINDMNEQVVITARDFGGTDGYSKAGFNIGDKVTYLDLLYGILLPSGAEAANAVAYSISGDINKFVDLMNAKAEELNMTNTRFANPVGKDDVYNYSTAKDVSKLLKNALKNEMFKKIFSTREYTTTTGLELKSTLTHYGKLFDTSIITGAKSGFTKGAGRCLASVSQINGVDYLFVVIKSDATENFNAVKDTLTVYNYYGNNYGYQDIISKETVIDTIPIKYGKIDTYEIKSNEDISMYLKNDANITYEYIGEEELNYKINNGDKLGVINILNNDDLIYTMDVYLNENIKYYHPVLYSVLGIILVVICLVILIVKNKKRKK